MKKKWLIIGIAIVVLAGLILTLPTSRNGDYNNATSKYYCNSDADCVPEQACHPTSCINEKFAPNKTGIFCTQICEPETLDCGQGSCGCVDNKCTAVFSGSLNKRR